MLAVSTAGYEWVERVGPPKLNPNEAPRTEPWLTPIDPAGQARLYDPLSARDLARRLARVPPTSEGVRRFASRYGLLGHDFLPPDGAFQPEEGGSGPLVPGDPFAAWVQAIGAVSQAVILFDLLHQERDDELRRVVRWERHPCRVSIFVATAGGRIVPEVGRRIRDRKVPRPESDGAPRAPWEGYATAKSPVNITMSVLAAEGRGELDDSLLRHWTYGEVFEPIRWWLSKCVNQQLDGHVRTHVALSGDGGDLRHLPDCLLAACWLSLTLDFTGRRPTTAVCARPDCGQTFRPGRRGQKFCQASCRKLSWWHGQAARID